MTLEELLQDHPDPIQELSRTLRSLVLRVLPGLEERVYPGWHALGFRDQEAGYLVGIFPFHDRVRLLFEHGARLQDPQKVLEGQDKRQVRYITMEPHKVIPEAAINDLLKSALHYGRLKASMKVRSVRGTRR